MSWPTRQRSVPSMPSLTDTPVAYLELPWLAQALSVAPAYQRKTMTELRKPLPHEVGSVLETLVTDGTDLRIEMVATVEADSIIARNPQILGTGPQGKIYNSWLMATEVVAKNYGPDVLAGLDHTFQMHRRLGFLRALPLTHALMARLNVQGEELLR